MNKPFDFRAFSGTGIIFVPRLFFKNISDILVGNAVFYHGFKLSTPRSPEAYETRNPNPAGPPPGFWFRVS